MQTVILAGGKGTRLRPLTYKTPKPMILLNGKPFLQYQLELVRAFGLSEALLLVGYLGDKIQQYFGNGARFGMSIMYSYEISPLGTAGALMNAKDKLAEEFLLLNGDTFLDINYERLIAYFYQCNKLGVIAAYKTQEKTAGCNIDIDGSNMAVRYNKKDSRGMDYVDAGAGVYKKDMLNLIPENSVCSLEEEIFPKLVQKKELMAFVTNKRFYDIGSLENLKAIMGILK